MNYQALNNHNMHNTIPNRYKEVSFKDVPQNIQNIYQEILKTKKGIYIHGGVGTGKTHILYALLKQWNQDREAQVENISNIKKEHEYNHYQETEKGTSYVIDKEKEEARDKALEQAGKVRPEAFAVNVSKMLYDARGDYKNNTGFQDKIIESNKLMLLDDIGSEKVTEWVEEFLYLTVNKRYEHVHPMIFTSNLPLSKLAEKIGDRTVSRIKEMCHIIEIKGTDRRLAK